MKNIFSKKAAAVILAATVAVSGYAGAGYVLAEEMETVETTEAAPVAETEIVETTAAPTTEAPAETTAAPATEAPAAETTAAPQTEAPAETETAAVTEAVTEETSAEAETAEEAVTEESTGEITTEEITSEEYTEETTEEVSEETTEEVTEETSEETTEEVSEETTEEAAYKTELSYENDEVVIIAKVSEEAQLPESAELTVEKLLPGSAKYEEAKQASIRDLGTAEDAEYNFYDVEFYADGEKIEVADGLATIRMTFKNVSVSGENQTESALYIEETETGAVARDVTAEAEAGSAVGSVEFQF